MRCTRVGATSSRRGPAPAPPPAQDTPRRARGCRRRPTTVRSVPTDIVPTARELLDALGSNTWTDGRADRLIETLAQSMGRAAPAESREALAMLASGLNSLDPEPAGVASRIVGAMIEAGHDPQPARAAMLGALQTTLPLCASVAKGSATSSAKRRHPTSRDARQGKSAGIGARRTVARP